MEFDEFIVLLGAILDMGQSLVYSFFVGRGVFLLT